MPIIWKWCINIYIYYTHEYIHLKKNTTALRMLNTILYATMNNLLQIKCSYCNRICGDTTFTVYDDFLSVNTMVPSLVLIFPKTHVNNTNKNTD